jgi:hypothetical protein
MGMLGSSLGLGGSNSLGGLQSSAGGGFNTQQQSQPQPERHKVGPQRRKGFVSSQPGGRRRLTFADQIRPVTTPAEVLLWNQLYPEYTKKCQTNWKAMAIMWNTQLALRGRISEPLQMLFPKDDRQLKAYQHKLTLQQSQSLSIMSASPQPSFHPFLPHHFPPQQNAFQSMMSAAARQEPTQPSQSTQPPAGDQRGTGRGGKGGIKHCRGCRDAGVTVQLTAAHKAVCPHFIRKHPTAASKAKGGQEKAMKRVGAKRAKMVAKGYDVVLHQGQAEEQNDEEDEEGGSD